MSKHRMFLWFSRTLAGYAAAGLLAGCGLGNGLYNVTLPGGADLGDHPYSVTIAFHDAEDLVPQAGVKVNDVAVGRVAAIGLDRSGTVAEVTVDLNGSVHLPANASASIQQTSLLGEKYVALAAPSGTPAVGRLLDHARIPLSRTSDGVQVEQVLGALSLLLNGGGIGQLHDIVHELNQVADGRPDRIRTFLASADRVVGQLDAHRSSITRALDALATLSHTLDGQNGRIKAVLDSLAPGIDVIARQRHQLTGALAALNDLSTATVHTLNASGTDIVADLRALAPTLTQLADADSALPRSLQELLTFPFSDASVDGIQGDYLNVYATVVLRTPGGTVYPTAATHTQIRSAASPSVVPTPSGILPATSAAAPGLPSTLTLSPPSSSYTTASPSPSPSVSVAGGSSSTHPPGSRASGTPTGHGSATGSGSPTRTTPPGSSMSSGSDTPSTTGGQR